MESLRAYLRMVSYMSKITFHLMYGIARIAKLKSAPVTIFGGSRLKPNSIYMKDAMELAEMLAKEGIPVLTGGGPGIMEAAACGAERTQSKVIKSIGITVQGLKVGGQECEHNIIEMNNFGARKWLLISFSTGFAVFPGGFGTANELTELLTLIQNNLRAKAPIVLIGIEYWKPFMDWMINSALKEGLVGKEDVSLFTQTDDIKEAFDRLKLHAHIQGFPWD